jgi:hypothetical protein
VTRCGGRALLGSGEADAGGFVGLVLGDELAAEGAGQDAAFQVVEESEGAGGFTLGRFTERTERIDAISELLLLSDWWEANFEALQSSLIDDGKRRR